jgi:uncharacterized protein Yka (UPF0111/DUF47 family)
MRLARWFLPDQPDVIALLRRQVGVTLEGLDAFAAWAGGDPAAARVVRDSEPQGDLAKRDVIDALRTAFVTPLEPEDAFALARGIDWILDQARDLVAEAEVLDVGPDPGIAEMAVLLGEAVRRIDDAIALLVEDGERATAAAGEAIAVEHRVEAAYYRGMAALLSLEDMRHRIARRELYRRCARIGEVVIDVAERVMYAVVKQS